MSAVFVTVPDEPSNGPKISKFPHSQSVDEGTPVKFSFSADAAESGIYIF